jgi:protein-export membrane protein SecD
MLSGESLVDAKVAFDKGQPVVSFRFNNKGGQKFGRITMRNVNKRFAIVLDNEVLSAPNINEPIMGGSGIITGGFKLEEANQLALLLRSGALPAPLKIVEERTVGASLGQDSVDSGKVASLVALVAVSIFMIIIYKFWGVASTISLAINLTLLIGLLSVLQATLTLPGIAGIVLTIGMAVDANVLSFERVRRELKQNKHKRPLNAIKSGYAKSFSAIIDANITTLIATLILYLMGVGPIKGFAVTLSFGVISSLFTALMVTPIFIKLYYRARGNVASEK